MTSFPLLTVLIIIGLLQVCTANPLSSREEKDLDFSEAEIDPTKLFTADVLTRAKNAGISVSQLVEWKSLGVTFDQVMKLDAFSSDPTLREATFKNSAKYCEILNPGHRMTSKYTKAQEANLPNILELAELMPKKDAFSFIRTTFCDFVSDPYSFDPNFVPHMKLRLLKAYDKTYSGLDRVNFAKRMCCLGTGGTIFRDKNVTGLRDDEMNEFEQQWNHVATTNGVESIKYLCHFLHSTNTFDDGQCGKTVTVVDSKK